MYWELTKLLDYQAVRWGYFVFSMIPIDALFFIFSSANLLSWFAINSVMAKIKSIQILPSD